MAVQNWTTGFEGTPAGDDSPTGGDDRIRELKETVRAVIAKEHDLDPTAADVIADQGWHKPGSAKVYVQSSAPTTRPDGATALDTDDTGRLWIDSDNSTMDYWSGAAWADVAIGDQTVSTTSDVTFATVTTDSVTADSISGVRVTQGSFLGSIYGDLYDAIAPAFDAVGQEIIISGSRIDGILVTIFSRAKRSSATEVTLYGVAIDITGGGTSVVTDVITTATATVFFDLRASW